MNKKKLLYIVLLFFSAILFGLSMPPYFNLPFLGFVALVPVILAFHLFAKENKFLTGVIFFGLTYSLMAYSWYIDIFSSLLGVTLIIAMAFWHTGLIQNGIRFSNLMPKKMKVYSIPIIYSLLEFLQRNIPVINQWWFIPYPKTQWGFPQALQILSITGISGATFFMILSNVSIAKIIENIVLHKKQEKILYLNLLLIFSVLLWGWFSVNMLEDKSNKSYSIGLVSDMANTMTKNDSEGYYVRDKEIRNQILNKNIELSNTILAEVDFLVWSENEFFNLADTEILTKLKKIAKQTNTYLVVDAYQKDKDALYDTAVLIQPNDKVGGIVRKTHLFSEELAAGFSASTEEPAPISTDLERIGISVCYDFHFLDVIRTLAKGESKIVLMPTDDDMNQNKYFPYYHATDAVFRAIENRVAVGSANTNGASILVAPTGEIITMSSINKESAIKGRVFINSNRSIYNRLGEWFGYLLLIVTILFFVKKIKEYSW